MLIVLVVVGIGLLLFGALVVLKFPDKPGGTINASIGGHGVEVSSVGAGLPVIAIGAGMLVLAAFVPAPQGDDARSPAASAQLPDVPAGARVCPDHLLATLPSDRVRTMETGATAQALVTANQPKSGAFGVRLQSGGRLVGAIRMEFFPDSQIFKVGAVVDPACAAVEDFRNSVRPGNDKHVLQNWDPLELRIGGQSYAFRPGLGGTGVIEADFSRLTP